MDADRLRAATDEDLARTAQADRDGPEGRAAATELLGRYGPRVYGLCRKYARGGEGALDLSQDVLLAAFRALGTFEGRAPFSAWIFAIARHRCIRAARPVSWTRDEEMDLNGVTDHPPGPDVLLEIAEERELVERIIEEHLEPMERQALYMRCLERRPVDDITRALGIEQASGARGVLQTARRKLRAALQARGIDPEGSAR